MEIEAQGGLLGLVAIGGKTSEQVHEEVDRAAVARVLNLAHILELIDDRLDECAFAQERLVGEGYEDVAHVLAQFGDKAPI
jgi:hypothetical protein